MVSSSDRKKETHIEECKRKLQQLLREFNCELVEGNSNVLLRCRETRQLRGRLNG